VLGRQEKNAGPKQVVLNIGSIEFQRLGEFGVSPILGLFCKLRKYIPVVF